MKEIDEIISRNVIFRAPKSIEEMLEFTNAFKGPNRKELADNCITGKLEIDALIEESYVKKCNEAREKTNRKILDLAEVKQEEWGVRGLVSKKFKSNQDNESQASMSKGAKKAALFPNMPKRRNDWFDAIYAMTEIYHEKHGEIPSIGQAWSILWNDPPEGHKIATKTVLHINYLVMGGNDLSENSFKKRWRNYTTSPNKGE